jgi:hypothetical protein
MNKLNIVEPKTSEDLGAALFRRNMTAFLKKHIADFETKVPNLGIFWYEIEKDGNVTFAGLKESYKRGVDNGSFLTYDGDHYTIWEEIQKQYPQWKGKKYNKVPRGRISFDKEEMIFIMFMPVKDSSNKELIQLICDYYSVPRELLEVKQDSHY